MTQHWTRIGVKLPLLTVLPFAVLLLCNCGVATIHAALVGAQFQQSNSGGVVIDPFGSLFINGLERKWCGYAWID